MYIESKSLRDFLFFWLLFVGKFQLMGERFFFEAFEKIPDLLFELSQMFHQLEAYFGFRFHHVVVFFFIPF